jgi:YebC/PmpR family DNA-binding regulatory protein
MGRVFEKRKHKMFARYDKMAKAFTRIGKEIVMAVKASGPNPDQNPRLRLCIQNAKGVNMPKDRIDAAIKRAHDKDLKDLEEIVYEGYGPNGVAIVIECATDNSTRTVATVRMLLTRGEGTLGKTGSLDFLFSRKGVFKFKAEGQNMDDLELELIDFGLEDIALSDDGELYVYTDYADFGKMSKALEDRKIDVISAELQRIPNTLVELTGEAEDAILELVEKLEAEDDVQAVYHNMK